MSAAKGAVTGNNRIIIQEWVQLYADGMYTWAYYKTSDKALAEDLVQDTFLAALQAVDNFKQDSQPKTWLFSILNNKIIDHFRKQFRNPVVNEADSGLSFFFNSDEEWYRERRPQEWGTTDAHILDDPDFRKILQHCMHLLPGSWLAAVKLKYLEEKDGKEICQDLQITPSNFWQIMHRAKLHLRNCLENNWFKK
ncbi:MAG TPA: sigma-70 family RNA polymerase sigma factor [Chitinophaga sp.]|uniref:sigma-70 family RNA polymerase sigma factor n=1 Tax=Chitinophaga sp. TaxID=1869181 RepID=UPI002DB7209A|nr:sigma-70 family RNA polymerase sigma factor [Chitinophaga sp.]HEU4554639.1 sigma-70 family RNA polymerase sigma factor [Chitinophaga sp.]